MLVLSRKVGETVIIGQEIVVTVLAIRGDRVRLGIEAPREVGIRRSELAERDEPVAESDDRRSTQTVAG